MASFHLSIKSGKRGTAATHAAYIARQGKHGNNGKKEDLVFSQHGNLPEWAKGDPNAFWKAADTYERANGSTYREFELALPIELTQPQRIELAQQFIQQTVGNKTFQLAIHEPKASIGGSSQPHLHAMVSDRLQDSIKRVPEKHFKRFNANHPENGGCRKDSGGKSPFEVSLNLRVLREKWAVLQNEHLAKHGHTARVDHRSYRERGVNAEPEKHMGAAAIEKMGPGEKAHIRKKRNKLLLK